METQKKTEKTFLIRIENTQIKVIKRTLNIPDNLVDEDEIIEYVNDEGLVEDDAVYPVDFVRQEIVRDDLYSNVEEVTLVS